MKRNKFNYDKTYKFAEIIYPIDNGTRNRYAVVTEVRKGWSYKSIKWFDCWDCAHVFASLLKNGIITKKMLREWGK